MGMRKGKLFRYLGKRARKEERKEKEKKENEKGRT